MARKNTRPIVHEFKCGCDMGSIKIFGPCMSAFFMNNIGDGTNTVQIHEAPDPGTRHRCESGEFLGHFTVKSTGVSLSGYDCADDPVYEFGPGRWFVYLSKGRVFDILLQDQDTHA